MNARAMKSRLLALFDRLQRELSDENTRAVVTAQLAVVASEILTYDDYVQVMTAARASSRAA